MSADADSNINLYAFWKHHDGTVLTYLHGKVTRILQDGRVNVKGYQGFVLTPALLLPIEAGLALGQRIEVERNATRVELATRRIAGEERIASMLKIPIALEPDACR